MPTLSNLLVQASDTLSSCASHALYAAVTGIQALSVLTGLNPELLAAGVGGFLIFVVVQIGIRGQVVRLTQDIPFTACTAIKVTMNPSFRHSHLLPRCYQDRATQPQQGPYREHPALLLLVGLRCLRLD